MLTDQGRCTMVDKQTSERILSEQDKGAEKMYQVLYPQIKKIAHLQISKLRPGQTITPTVLSHECFIKLSKFKGTEFESDKHFFYTVAKCMRNYLIDVIRHKNRHKHAVQFDEMTLSLVSDHNNIEDKLLEINQMIDQLACIDKSLAELTELRFFGGFSLDEIAGFQGISKRQVVRHWNMAKSFFITLLADKSI